MLIQCPECGHQVSDKAPVCPHCGIEIANHITTISTEEPFDEIPVVAEPIAEEPVIAEPVSPATSIPPTPSVRNTPRKGHGTLIISFLIAALICATVLYFYKDAIDKRDAGKQPGTELADTLGTDTKNGELTRQTENEVISENPAEDTEESLTEATEETPSAEDEKPKTETDQPKSSTATAEEKQKTFMAVRRFFQAINAHSSAGIRSTTTAKMTSFGAISNATPDDVVNYMNSLYTEDVTNLNFHLGSVSSIEKKEAGSSSEYEITLPAKKVTEHGDKKSETNYHVKATVTADGKVKAMTINQDS